MLLNDFKRAVKSKKFLAIIIIGLLIHFLGLFMEIKDYLFFNYNAPDLQTPKAQAAAKAMVTKGLNIYAVWFSIFKYYTVAMPILSVLPFSLSYLEDTNSGLIKNIDIRINHSKYILAKIFANGISSAIAISLPTIIISLIVPIFFKGSIDDFYGKGMYGGIFSSVLTYNFFLYIVLHIFINFIFGFAYSTIALAVSSLVKNKIAVMLSSVLFWIGGSILFSFFNITRFTPSVINQFYACPTVTFPEIIVELMLITVVSALIFILNSRKRKIYES